MNLNESILHHGETFPPTMKLIFYSVVSKKLILQGFLDIEKERKLQYLWYHNFRSYMVDMKGIEPSTLRMRTVRSPS